MSIEIYKRFKLKCSSCDFKTDFNTEQEAIDFASLHIENHSGFYGPEVQITEKTIVTKKRD